jgi:glutathione S-transferase
MWTRRVELAYCQPVTAAFRYGPALGLFRDRVHCIPHAAEDMADIAREGAAWIDAQMPPGPYLAGERFSMADIVLFCFADFAMRRARLPIDGSLTRLKAWFDRVATRPSARQTEAAAYG